MSPKLENKPITRGRLLGQLSFELVKLFFVYFWKIFENIGEFIHSWWNLSYQEQLVCISHIALYYGETSYFRRSWHYCNAELWEVIISMVEWIILKLDTEFFIDIEFELIPQFRCIYIIVGEWYRNHLVDVRHIFVVFRVPKRRFQSADKQVWHCTNKTRPTSSLYLVVRSNVVVVYYCM